MEEKTKLFRMRTIPKALIELKKNDPDTSITYSFLKKICEEEKIPCIKEGNRFILNFDTLLDYLSKN